MKTKEKIENRSDEVLERAYQIGRFIWSQRIGDYKVLATIHRNNIQSHIEPMLVKAGLQSEITINVGTEQTKIGVVDPDDKRTHEVTIYHRCKMDYETGEVGPVDKVGINWFGSSIEDCVNEPHSVDYLLVVGLVAKELNKGADFVQKIVNMARELTASNTIESRLRWATERIVKEQQRRKRAVKEKAKKIVEMIEAGVLTFKTKGYFNESLKGMGTCVSPLDGDMVRLSKPERNEYDMVFVNIVGQDNGQKVEGQIRLDLIHQKIDIEK